MMRDHEVYIEFAASTIGSYYHFWHKIPHT